MSPYYNYYLDRLEERRQARYAVVIFLPDHLDEIIAPLRERYDPLYNLVASHVTLVFPFESGRSLDEIARLVTAETEGQPGMWIELESIGDYYPRVPLIYWNVKPNVPLGNVSYRLHSRLGLPIPYKDFQPHVTVAREISHHRVMLVKENIVSYLPTEKFLAQKIDLISPMPDNKWVSVRTFTLAG
ncbi:MAG TPA: 2'-5' RNA ligase family protein [Candidatus Deferrimicrobium sp.]|nr:2'-5' RNA ligase family protein [Candidatus Deferrimicrobium sp.]